MARPGPVLEEIVHRRVSMTTTASLGEAEFLAHHGQRHVDDRFIEDRHQGADAQDDEGCSSP
jgi:hypothetical protein